MKHYEKSGSSVQALSLFCGNVLFKLNDLFIVIVKNLVLHFSSLKLRIKGMAVLIGEEALFL